MPGHQSLDAADARDHFIVEVDTLTLPDQLDDADRAVIERRIAPDEKAAATVIAKLFEHHPLEDEGALFIPVLDRRLIGRRLAVALRITRFDDTVVRFADIFVAQEFAQERRDRPFPHPCR